MSCCGRRRAGPISSDAAGVNGAGAEGAVRLRFLGRPEIKVAGPVTRRDYAFSPAIPVCLVDHRDAAGLLRTGYFAVS